MADNLHPHLQQLNFQVRLFQVLIIFAETLPPCYLPDLVLYGKLLIGSFNSVLRPLYLLFCLVYAEVVLVREDDSVEVGQETLC